VRTDFDDCLPWLPYEAIIWLLLHTQPSNTIFEWGGGASTLFFRRRGHQVTTVEHNVGWAKIAGVEPVWKRSPGYVAALDRPYDIVLVDGRRRDECFARAIPFVRKCLVLDDSDRPENARLESLVPAGWTTLHIDGKGRCNPKRSGKTIDSMTSIFVPPSAKMGGQGCAP